MAQKEKDCPLGKGDIPNALHRLQGAHPHMRVGGSRGGSGRVTQKNIKLEPWKLGVLDL